MEGNQRSWPKVVLLSALVSLGVTTAYAAPRLTQAQLQERFDTVDRNADMVITADELASVRIENFQKIDRNNDGEIQEGEMMGYRSPRAGKYLTRRQFELRRKAFYKMDQDLDRQISLEEYLVKAKQGFRSLDSNRDNRITFEEFSRKTNTDRKPSIGN